MARANWNSDACGVVGVMWNLWCVGETPALRTLVYTREIRRNSRRNSLGVALGPSRSRPKLVALGGACADHCACITYLERVSV